MSIMKQVTDKIKKFPKGKIFTMNDFNLDVSSQTLAKSLSRLTKENKIKRFSKGRYYKPERGLFVGALPPDKSEILKSFTKKNGKIIAYKSGITLYYEMGLTTQIPNVVILATTKSIRKQLPTNSLRFRTVRAYAEPKAGNIKFLQILDAVRDYREIPDTPKDEILRRLRTLIKNYVQENEFEKMIALAENYPPRTRAILGAILDSIGVKTDTLKAMQNPLTTFKPYTLGISSDVLPNLKNWNIK